MQYSKAVQLSPPLNYKDCVLHWNGKNRFIIEVFDYELNAVDFAIYWRAKTHPYENTASINSKITVLQ